MLRATDRAAPGLAGQSNYHTIQLSRRCVMSKKPYGVLILHGFTSSLDCVREIEPPLLALELPSRMPVLRGHGAESPDALRGVTWHDWVSDAESALKDLLAEVDKAIVIGHSMGGLVTLTLAIEYGEKIDSIVVAAAALQLSSPLAPGKPLNFLAPLVLRVLKTRDFLPVYADPELAQYNTNYPWAPTDAIYSLFDFAKITRKRLSSINTPMLILHSHRDSTVAPETADIIFNGISTPESQKRIVWFEKTEHEMFRDCERVAIIDVITNYVRERIGAK
jgi:carboxylesterase